VDDMEVVVIGHMPRPRDDGQLAVKVVHYSHVKPSTMMNHWPMVSAPKVEPAIP
jgi:hypothetical protein